MALRVVQTINLDSLQADLSVLDDDTPLTGYHFQDGQVTIGGLPATVLTVTALEHGVTQLRYFIEQVELQLYNVKSPRPVHQLVTTRTTSEVSLKLSINGVSVLDHVWNSSTDLISVAPRPAQTLEWSNFVRVIDHLELLLEMIGYTPGV